MPTVNANLFVDNAGNTLLFNWLGGTPAIPAMNAGDTLALQVFHFDRGSGGSPFRDHRYAGSSTRVRLRAAGNNTIYADSGLTTSEIVPSTGATVARTQAGGGAAIEKQSVTFAAGLFRTGTFKIGFSGAGSGGRGGGVSLEGTTAAIPITASAADVLAAILAVRGFYKSNDGPHTFAELAAIYGPQAPQPVVTGTPSTGFVVEFGSLYGGANYWNTSIHLLTIDDSDVQYAYGWTVNLLLDGNGHTFTDLFLTANTPAYLEVLLTPSGGSEAYAAQYQLVSSGGGSGSPPPPIGGGGGGPGDTTAGIMFIDGDFTVAKAVDVVRVEQPFPQTPSAKIYRQPYWQMDSSWSPLTPDSACPYDPSAGLVEEGPQRSAGGGRIVAWDRVWATVPPTRIEYDLINYIWLVMGVSGGANALASFNLTRRAKITHSYFRTTDGGSITLARLPRVTLFANAFYYTEGSYSNPTLGSEVIARDDTIERWMGNIWHKTHTTIVL